MRADDTTVGSGTTRRRSGFGSVLVLVAGLTPKAAAQGGHDLRFETGVVAVKGDVATIDLPSGWRYLQQEDARFVVERVWRNRPNPKTLGLVLPPPQDDWGGILVSYLASGYVAVADPFLDQGQLLALLREELAATNALRRRAGLPTAELLGWADPPRFDHVAKTLRWGKMLRVGEEAQPTVNYEARALGAEGVLLLQAVASRDDLDVVKAGVALVLSRIELAPGLRYEDHDPERHRVSPRTLAGLIVENTARVSPLRVAIKPIIAIAVVALALLLSRYRRRGRALAPCPDA